MNGDRKRDVSDEIFKRLRESEPYLADSGFTAAVISKLPKQAKLPLWKQNGLIVFFALIGIALAAAILPLQAISIELLVGSLVTQIMKLEIFGLIAAATFSLAGAALWFANHEI